MPKVLQVFNEEKDLIHISTHVTLEGARDRAKGIEKNPPKLPLKLAEYWVSMSEGKTYEYVISDLEVEK